MLEADQQEVRQKSKAMGILFHRLLDQVFFNIILEFCCLSEHALPGENHISLDLGMSCSSHTGKQHSQQ